MFAQDFFLVPFFFSLNQDDDTRNVMNAMSNPTREILDKLKFYIVPKSWFLKAWPLLTAQTHDNIKDGWREEIGTIHVGELTNVEREVSSSDDESAERQKKRFEQLHLRMAKSRQQAVMKTGLEHTKDYFFLGPSAWLLVKEKFGFDGYELARYCVSNGASVLSVQLQAEESEGNTATLIEIPPSGRFAYEKILLDDNNDKSMLVPDEDQGNSTVCIFSARLLLFSRHCLSRPVLKTNHFIHFPEDSFCQCQR